MAFHGSLEQLEAAARILLAPPNIVSKDERTSAENMFLEFRKTRNAFGLCKFILEHSQTELLVFETADVLRNNLIQDWNKVPPEDIQTLNNNLLTILVNPSGTRLSFSAQRRLAAVVALIVKHQSLIQNGKQRMELITHLINTVVSNNSILISACCIFDAIMVEHQYVVNVTDASLTYEMHFAAKKDFENTDLLRIFQFSLLWLRSYTHEPTNVMKIRDLDHILKLVESVLYWNFTKNLPRRVAGVVEMEATPAFKPPTSWSETIANAAFIPVFFEIHRVLRTDENFILRTVNTILQLVTLHGPLVNSRDTRVDFLSRLIPPFTELLNLPDKLPIETLGLSDIMRKIMLFHRTGTLLGLTPTMFNDFIKAAGNFTCYVIQMSIVEESKAVVDDRVYRESLTRVLEAWMNILTDTDGNGPKEVLSPVATNIFNAFLQAHISPPEGFRQSTEIINEDIEPEDDADSVQFRDQLQAMGVFGRFILHHSIPVLSNLLTYKCQAFQNQVQVVASNSVGRQTLDLLNEDLHWILLIAGHILAFDGLGETNLIPPEIMEVSLHNSGNGDISALAVQNAFQLLPIPDGPVDPVVGLVCRVISLAEMERRVMESNLGHLLSPEVANNVLWFLHRWAQSYFNMNEEYYPSVSSSFLSAWGSNSPTSTIAQTALFRRIREDLIRFSGEAEVIKEAINLLLALVDSNRKAETAIQSPELQPLLILTTQVGPGKYQMPIEQYKKFIRAMVTVGSYCEDNSQRATYWDQILNPLLSRLNTILALPPQDRHRDDVRQELSYVLAGLIGTAMSSNSKTAASLYEKFGSFVAECGGVLDTFHNYDDIVELCLEFITEVGKRSLSYLSHANSITLYEGAMGVVKSYALHASGRRNFEKTAEEDAYNDLTLLLDMLSCLLTKDFLDLSPEAVTDGLSPPISAAEVALQGLSIVMPFMNAELLRYPNLSTKYFRLVAFVTELHAEKVMNLPMPMIQALFESVQLGLQTTTTEGFTSCCEFILAISNYISLNNHQSSIPGEICRNFLKYFLEMILSDKVNKEAIPSVSSALFALISAFTESFNELAHQLILSRPVGETQQNLSDAFGKLTENLNLTGGGDRISRAAFRDRLENFIFVVRGCLD